MVTARTENLPSSAVVRAGVSQTTLAAAVAGAVDAPDLVERLAEALAHDGEERTAPIRIWLLEEAERPRLLAQFPARSKHPRDEPKAVVAAALMDDVLRAGSVLLTGLRRNGTPFGVLGIGARAIDPEALTELADVVAARLSVILDPEQSHSPSAAMRMVGARNDAQAVIAAFAAEAKRLLDHDRLSVYMVTPDGCAIERFAVATSPVLPGESEVIPLEEYGLTYVLQTNEPFVTNDFVGDERIASREGSIIAAGGFHGLVSVPLRVGGRPIGLLNFVSKTAGFYSDDDAVIAQQLADHVAIFFQNLRLEQRIRMSIEREAAQQERNRLARELHDTLAQELATMLLRLQGLSRRIDDADEEMEEDVLAMRSQTQTMLDQLRRSLLHLAPAELERKSLGDAMADVLARVEAENGVKTSIEIVGAPGVLTTETATAVFRIFQEAVTNACKHAEPTSLAATLHVGEGIFLAVEDNGRGFAQSSQPGQLGIQNMRARAEQIGGQLVVTSGEVAGTKITLTVAAPGSERVQGQRLVPAQPAHKSGTSGITRVLVVDDHPLFREAATRLLERQDDIRIVGQVATAAAAIAETRRRKPDVVLLDVELPDMSGIDAVRRLTALERPPKVLMISAFPESGPVVAAMKAGARGYVTKTIEGNGLVESIRAIGRGATIFDGPSGAGIWSPQQLAQLTRRELDVLRLVAAGKTNSEIADEFCLAKKTVERIVATAVAKLRAKNRAHAVARAVSLKLLDLRAED